MTLCWPERLPFPASDQVTDTPTAPWSPEQLEGIFMFIYSVLYSIFNEIDLVILCDSHPIVFSILVLVSYH